MSASVAHYHRPAVKCVSVLSPFLRHLNTGTLAFVLFIAFTLISSIRGKESENRDLASDDAAKSEVIISDFAFSPKTVTVPVGTTVTWTNHDSLPHTVTSAGNQFKKSTVLKTGQHFANTFPAAGTYSYFCSIHPRMTGKIIVK
jgi:plastocyanin